jgi:hypothetical protein
MASGTVRDPRFAHLAHPSVPITPGQFVGLKMADGSTSIQCIQEIGLAGCKLTPLGALLTTPGVWHPVASIRYLTPATNANAAYELAIDTEDACYM